ncbi:MAG: alpha-mannosidase [Phormidesmis sp.]
MTSSDFNLDISPSLKGDLDRLRQLNTQDIQANWRWHPHDIPPADIFNSQTSLQWPIASLNSRQHVAWEKGRKVRWLYQTITVPDAFQGYPLAGMTLRFALTWWADDAQIYIDGTLAQSGDLFECFTRLCLSTSVSPGQTFQLAIRLVSPGHDEGALVRSHLIYELPDTATTPEPSFVADELTVLATFEPSIQPEIESALSQLNWASLTQTYPNSSPIKIAATAHPFQHSLTQVRETLISLTPPLKQRQIQCVGHAHLDMAWLWPIADTWNAAERTFQSVLDLQKDFPDLTYTHSSPALFEWLEHNRPELFQQIQQKVTEGSWSIDAGLWIEPEFNLIGGEAIARHILYGQHYCQEKFGKISKIAWLPDSFGFCWQLPQLLTQGGIEIFATLKLSWNDTTEFPHSLFWWESPDGSRILSLMLPPIGTDIDPIKMSAHAKKWETRTQLPNTLWLPGLGDHGGGPTRDMLEKAYRWQQSPFFPTLTFTTPKNYINTLPRSPVPPLSSPHLPLWQTDLYLELHRGCYTTHADQKQHNRRCEDLLYQAEVFATIAYLKANQPYPKADLERAWKSLLFNQFHDILPGTAIPEVFVEANQAWEQVRSIGQRILDESIGAIASTIPLPKPPHPLAKAIVVFNPLSWSRNAVITLSVPSFSPDAAHSSWSIYDGTHQLVPYQTDSKEVAEQIDRDLSFLAQNLPAVGYQNFWLCPTREKASQPPEDYSLENEFLKVTIDPETGQIVSLIEKSTQKETFSTPGNQLQTFRDQGQYWDAWNIDPEYASHPLPGPALQSIRWIKAGPVRQELKVTYRFNQSTISQNHILETGVPFLKIETFIDWQETHVLLKAYFPLSISSEIATYEIPFGAIARKTTPETAAEKAQWEVPALRWADLSNQSFGMCLLTQGKHGFDASPNHLRLSLLKSPVWPDPNADKGSHHFAYAIYPHTGSWQTARAAHAAREFTIAPIVHRPEFTSPNNKVGQCRQSFLQVQNANLILSAFKLTEDDSDDLILRCYEAYGENAIVDITHSLGVIGLDEGTITNASIHTDLIETPIHSKNPTNVRPWQIATYRLKKPTVS